MRLKIILGRFRQTLYTHTHKRTTHSWPSAHTRTHSWPSAVAYIPVALRKDEAVYRLSPMEGLEAITLNHSERWQMLQTQMLVKGHQHIRHSYILEAFTDESPELCVS